MPDELKTTKPKIMEHYYQRQTDIFKVIDPAKKYSQFTYDELEIHQINGGDCYKGHIIKMGGLFYLYAACKTHLHSDEGVKSTIQFKHGKKIIAEIPQ